MTKTYIALAVLVLWYLCGIFNVAIMQAVVGDDEFKTYNRTNTLCMCYIPAPIVTLLFLGYGLVFKPIQYGTRLGRFIGRKLEDILD